MEVEPILFQKLKPLCVKIGSGATPRGGSGVYLDSGEYSLIRSQNVRNNTFSKDGLVFIDQEAAIKLDNVAIEESDVLLNITGDSVARCCQVDGSVLPARVNQHVAIIRPISKKLDPHYLRYFLVSPSMQNYMLGIAGAGATRNALTKGMIEDFDIPLPPIEKQKSIAHILGSLDDKIELNRRINATLESMAQALFKSWFVDFDPVIDNALAAGNPIPPELAARAEARKPFQAQAASRQPPGEQRKPLPAAIRQQFPNRFVFTEQMGWVPEGWAVKLIGEVLELAYGKSLPATKRIAGNVPVFGSGGLSGLHNEKLVDAPGIVVGRKGTVGSLYWVNDDFFPIDTVFYVVNKMHVPLYWLYQTLGLIDIKSMGADSAVPGVNRNTVYARYVTVPDKGVFDGYLNQIDSYNSRRNVLDGQREALANLRDTLLPKLLSGQLRIPEAEQLLASHTDLPLRAKAI